jgi:predicted RNA-binding protein
MSEQKPNHECKICGKKYYACISCDKVNHWKSVACCPEHYAQYVELVTNERNKTEVTEVKNNDIKDEVVVEATEEVITENLSKKKNSRFKISEESEL